MVVWQYFGCFYGANKCVEGIQNSIHVLCFAVETMAALKFSITSHNTAHYISFITGKTTC